MKICMVAYSFYEFDNRIRRYAETLSARGDQVDVIALRWENDAPTGDVNGVHIYRIQKRPLSKTSKIGYLARLSLFWIRSTLLLSWNHLRVPYDLIHVHSVPDFEVFAAWLPKLTGAKVILDIHDIVPEFYAEKFHQPHGTPLFKMLVFIERCSTTFADHVIVANHIWEKRLAERSVRSSKLTTILNYPDLPLEKKTIERRHRDGVILIYPGTLAYHQGLDIAIRAFARIQKEAPEAEFHIYGAGDQYSFLEEVINQLNLQKCVFLKGVLRQEQIIRAISNADIGIVPKRKDGFGNEAFSTKILEFMCLSVPVVIPNTLVDTFYFSDSVARFFEANDESSLASAMLELIRHPEKRLSLASNANQFVRDFLWGRNKDRYLGLVDTLCANNRKADMPL